MLVLRNKKQYSVIIRVSVITRVHGTLCDLTYALTSFVAKVRLERNTVGHDVRGSWFPTSVSLSDGGSPVSNSLGR